MNRKLLTLLLSLALALAVWGGLPVHKAQAAITSVTIVYWPSHIPMDASNPCDTGGGTAYGVYVTVTGDPNENFTLSTAVGSTGCTWDAVNGAWRTEIATWDLYPRYNTGPTGTVSMWVYGRVYAGTSSSLLRISAYPCNADWSLCFAPTFSTKTITKMDMTTQGGWLVETGEAGRQGRTIVVRNGATINGIYIAEDNGINEGYAYAAGGYKVSVPACANCGYTIETWLPSAPGTAEGGINTMGANGCPSDIVAGAISSLDTCNSPTAILLESFAGTSQGGVTTLILVSLALAFVMGGLILVQRRRNSGPAL